MAGRVEGGRVGLFLAAFFASGAVLTAFLPLWLASRGLTAAAIGEALGLASLLRVAAVPCWGWMADAAGRPRTMLFAAAALAGSCAAVLPLASGRAVLVGLVVAGGIAASALAPLTDAMSLALAAARRLDYGRTRAWGSVSYMLATAGAGFLLGGAGIALVPVLLAGGYGGAALLAPALPRAELPERRGTQPAPLGPMFWRTLAATALIQGSHAAYYGFAGLHWHAAGLSDAAIGLLIAEGIVAEVALFIWGRELAERLGPAGLTALAASCCLVRWTATGLSSAVPVLVAAQFLHAGTFACQHLSAMGVLRTLPPARAALAQTALAALGFSAPTGLLIWLSGRLYAAQGGRVFLLMAAVGGAALLLVPLLPRGSRRP